MLEALDYSNRVKIRNSVKKLDDAKIQLEGIYFKEKENFAQGKADKIRGAADYQKSKIVWETVNEFTGRKGTNKGRIKAKVLKKHQKLERSLPESVRAATSYKTKETKTALQHALPVNIENFTMEELNK